MLDLDQRVVDGLRELGRRAPVDAEVWAGAEHHLATRRRRRRAVGGGAAVAMLVVAALTTIGIERASDSSPAPRPPVASRTLTAPLLETGPSVGTLTLDANPGGSLRFAPASLRATTGIYEIRLVEAGTLEAELRFDDPAVRFAGLVVGAEAHTASTRAFFGTPGTYTFFDPIPGHRAAGMVGTVQVSGPVLPASAAGR